MTLFCRLCCHRSVRTALALAALAALPLTTQAAQSGEIDGTTNGGTGVASFDQSLDCGGQTLQKRGEGRMRYLLWTIYDAALYLPDDATARSVLLPSTTRCLEISYTRDVSRDAFVEAAWKVLGDQHDDATLARIRPEVDALHALFADVRKGDRYRLQWNPQTGLVLWLNGKKVGDMASSELASYYFGIWLDEPAGAPALRVKLLGDRS